MGNNDGQVKIVKLRSISNEMELSMIKEILDDNDIAYMVKDHGAGGYMRIIGGSSLFETDVMVAESNLDKANELLKSIFID